MQTEHVQTIYQCTWPGCAVRKELCEDIESHVRVEHLRRGPPASSEEDDHEEEFYYTEIDVPLPGVFQPSAAAPAPLLSDHMDMARPPHENPEYGGRPVAGGQTGSPAAPAQHSFILPPGTAAIQWTGAGQESKAGAAAQPNTTTGADSAQQQQQTVHAVPIAIPITTFTIASSQHVSILNKLL